MIYVVSKSGVGGLPVTSAVFHVNAPVGSSVAFKKGSTTVKTFTSSDAHPNIDGVTADYYYAISPANYGSWTITATKGTQTKTSSAVSINAAKQYDVVINYELYLFKENVGLTSGYTSGYFGTAATVGNTITTGSTFYIKPSSGSINLSSYTTLHVEMKRTSVVSNKPIGVGAVPTGNGDTTQGSWDAKLDSTTSAYPDKKTFTLSISSVSTSNCFKLYGNGSTGNDTTIYNIWFT